MIYYLYVWVQEDLINKCNIKQLLFVVLSLLIKLLLTTPLSREKTNVRFRLLERHHRVPTCHSRTSLQATTHKGTCLVQAFHYDCSS